MRTRKQRNRITVTVKADDDPVQPPILHRRDGEITER
jgi:hypothetical protein